MSTDKALTIGDRLRKIRGSTSQKEFAKQLGVHFNTLGRYERNDRPLDADTLRRLAEMGYSEAYLIRGDEPNRIAMGIAEPIAPYDEDGKVKQIGQRMRAAYRLVDEALSAVNYSPTPLQREALRIVAFSYLVPLDHLALLAEAMKDSQSGSETGKG